MRVKTRLAWSVLCAAPAACARAQHVRRPQPEPELLVGDTSVLPETDPQDPERVLGDGAGALHHPLRTGPLRWDGNDAFGLRRREDGEPPGGDFWVIRRHEDHARQSKSAVDHEMLQREIAHGGYGFSAVGRQKPRDMVRLALEVGHADEAPYGILGFVVCQVLEPEVSFNGCEGCEPKLLATAESEAHVLREVVRYDRVVGVVRVGLTKPNAPLELPEGSFDVHIASTVSASDDTSPMHAH